jgi:hypothetical protein
MNTFKNKYSLHERWNESDRILKNIQTEFQLYVKDLVMQV